MMASMTTIEIAGAVGDCHIRLPGTEPVRGNVVISAGQGNWQD
jgi:hypothetical protein